MVIFTPNVIPLDNNELFSCKGEEDLNGERKEAFGAPFEPFFVTLFNFLSPIEAQRVALPPSP